MQVDLRDVLSIPGSGRSPGGEHGNPLQYSCLENLMNRGAWRATVHRVVQSWTSYSAHPHGGNSLLRYAYPTVKTLWDPGTQAPLAFRARESKGVPWVEATRTGHQMCVKVPFWKVLALWSMADRGQRWCPPYCLFWKVFQQAPGCVC